jgi:hypothetical protein
VENGCVEQVRVITKDNKNTYTYTYTYTYAISTSRVLITSRWAK